MKLELVYAESREELDKKVEGKIKEGWFPVSEIVTVRPPNLNKDIPNFVFYAQTIEKSFAL